MSSQHEQVKIEEVKVLIETKSEVKPETKVPVVPEVMDRETGKGCIKCAKTTASIFRCCISCWRFCLNSCEVVMDCNIRCCTCAKECLERIDCDETP